MQFTATDETLRRADVGAFVKEYLTSAKFAEDFDTLDSKERISVVCRLLPYAMPKLRSVGMEEELQGSEPDMAEILRALVNPPERK